MYTFFKSKQELDEFVERKIQERLDQMAAPKPLPDPLPRRSQMSTKQKVQFVSDHGFEDYKSLPE